MRAVCAGGLLAMLAVASLPTGSTSAADETNKRCAYVEAGVAGPGENILEIRAQQFSELTIARRGNRIRVLNAHERPIDCRGDTEATIDNIDAITTTYPGEQGYGPTIDLGGGALAPGATPESDETAEIEVTVTGGSQTGLFIVGSNGADAVELGTLSDGTIAVNLNPAAESAADVDVTMPPDGIFGAQLLDGNDLLDASGGSLVPGSPAQVELFISSAGANADEIVAGAQGGSMVGGTGRDQIVGGAGPDHIGAGPGNDFVSTRRGRKDLVQCGSGADSYEADRRDDLRLCERRARPRLNSS